MTDLVDLFRVGVVLSVEDRAAAQRKADARRAKGWKHTADFMNQLANTTVSLGFLAPLATWAFGVSNNPLSTGLQAAMIAVLWLCAGVFLHLVAGTIGRSFDL